MLDYLTNFMSTLLLEGDKTIDRFNMATIMILFLLITIEVVVVKVVVFEMENNEDNHFAQSPTLFFDQIQYLSNICRKKSEESGKKQIDDSRCDCCLKPFIIGKGVECWDCKARVCKKSCSHWDLADNNWHCLFCNHRRSWCKRNDKWFETFGGVEPNAFAIKKIFNTTETINLEDEHVAFNSDAELAAGGYETTNSMENVRKIIEKIVESLVGNVDNTPIDRIYNHAAYNKFIDEYGVLFSRIIKHLEFSLRNSSKIVNRNEWSIIVLSVASCRHAFTSTQFDKLLFYLCGF
ncbi:hypothetical protein KQX54_007481 [Cotesia glomerata]|uniref:Uncharacterized protein n=1 Tax=Cotesia glomerata TaxID=32391 RepID=A0AAV7HIE6_COTGL|nr:hypothetical protein KQX54_007481 [Cotesia glomerata]